MDGGVSRETQNGVKTGKNPLNSGVFDDCLPSQKPKIGAFGSDLMLSPRKFYSIFFCLPTKFFGAECYTKMLSFLPCFTDIL